MKKCKLIPIFLFITLISVSGFNSMALSAKSSSNTAIIPNDTITKTIDSLVKKYGQEIAPRVEKGVRQAAALWREADGNAEQFETFCMKHFYASEAERELVFKKVSKNFESLRGHFNKIILDLQEAVQLDNGPVHAIDGIFAGYGAGAHVASDFYKNKIAFICVLNFPFYSLAEKKELGEKWSRKEWAYARLGDTYTSRIPSKIIQEYAGTSAAAGMYIAGYNIYMGHVLNKKGVKLFPEDLRLLSHWNLRDEIKSHYSAGKKGLEKQQIIYQVMKRIISQEIPKDVVDNPALDWDPFKNKVFKDGNPVDFTSEPNTRYQHIINSFKVQKAIDMYSPPAMDTYIKRNFDDTMEISCPEVEALFIKVLSSPQAKKVGKLIRKRLKRKLQPYDIWYNGFRTGSDIPEEKLDSITKKKYPNAAALKKDLPSILVKLGFPKERAQFLASRIDVDPARGSGHAWGASMKSEKAHLRTRIAADGMNYKGYNIAVHEFGHNVEQTISLNDVDYYMMSGVPNTAFTEALAFIFQERDIQLLGLEESNPNKKHLTALKDFWSVYEIMGVSLVDINAWKWLYEHPEADAQQLKEAVIKIAIDIWNKYYAPVFGVKDQPILAVYSHMISSPLYLPNYAYGHLIDFQLSRYIEGKDLATEVDRFFSQGRYVPQLWMKKAVGKEISGDPLLEAVDDALKHIKK